MLDLLIATFAASFFSAGQLEPAEDRMPPIYETKDIQYAEREHAPVELTQLDVYNSKLLLNTDNKIELRPVIVYIHGGAWAYGDKRNVHLKPEWAARNDWLLVSVNHRLSPDVQHPAHAQDVAEAIAYIAENAMWWGGDRDQIVLIGHSAGAQIAAIVASEESLLGSHGMSPADLSGVVVLDGSGYHIEKRMTHPSTTEQARGWYADAFGEAPIAIEGTDETTWTMASATLQAKPGDELPPLLAVHAGMQLRSRQQAKVLVDAWTRTGAPGTMRHARGKDHSSVNQELGAEGDEYTLAVEAFIDEVVGE